MPATNACVTGTVNLLFLSLFKEVTVQFNNKTFSDTSNMYAYRAYLEPLINCIGDIKNNRLKAEGWHKDTHDKMDEADSKDNKGLIEGEKYCAESPEIVLIGRPHVDVFHIDKLIPPGIDVAIKLMSNDDKFLFMSADSGNLGPTVVIKEMNLIVETNQMSYATELPHRALVREQNMRLPYTCVMMKHVALLAGSSTVCLENIFTGGLPDLVMMCFVPDTAIAGSYTENPFTFKNLKMKRMDMFRNGIRVPRLGYQPNFTKKIYKTDYFTFQEQLGFDQGDRCVNLTPEEWANKFNLYSFKITDGPIGSGTPGPR